MLVGAGVLRADAAGYQLTELADGHFAAIHRQMEQALSDGALGVSLGLGYAPECFYSTADLIRALQPVAGTDIPVTVHMRQEGGGVAESVRGDDRRGPCAELPRSHQPPQGYGTGQLGQEDPTGADAFGAGAK